jgi:hypothetical protein
MPGFRHCSWCHSKGCMCCDAEQTKWEKAERERTERFATEDPRRKLARLTDPLTRQITEQLGGTEALATLDAEIAQAEAACNAEYRRQFPDGPKPIFSARLDNPGDVALLRQVFHREKLEEAFGSGGGGVAEVERNAEAARLAQALRQYAEDVAHVRTYGTGGQPPDV